MTLQNVVMLQNYGNSSVSLDKLGLSELTPGPATWNVEVFVQALKELVCNFKLFFEVHTYDKLNNY